MRSHSRGGQLDWSRAIIDSSHVRALRRGEHSGPSPVDRGRPGSKHHVLTNDVGIHLPTSLTGGNRNDVTQLVALLDQAPAVRGRRGRPRIGGDQELPDYAMTQRPSAHRKS
ncbi:MAG: transposase [Micromonosporaceae bacterium]|nr:transposase [Micromonosporaceae bacterium]